MYAGGTTMDEVKDAPNAITTILLQPAQLEKTKKFVENTWKHDVPKLEIPMGVEWTDNFLMKVSELTGKPIPASLELERGRCMDLISDSHAWLHGKKFALYGDPDFVMGMVKILLEVGAEPTHILSHNANKRWGKAVQKLLDASPFGKLGKVYVGNDLWHMRSLCFTDKPDFLIGNSYGKYIQRDTRHKGEEFEVPLIRIGFPIFDRHHQHRATTLGYEGMMAVVTQLTNAVLEQLDKETIGMGTTDYNFDLVR
jgi:nitrogenase molybdenum-iron protein beta chain